MHSPEFCTLCAGTPAAIAAAIASSGERPRGPRADDVVELGLAGAPLGRRQPGEVGPVEQRGERLPVGVVAAGDGHPRVVAGARVDAVRHHGDVGVAVAASSPGR